jgi:hypothetical protein
MIRLGSEIITIIERKYLLRSTVSSIMGVGSTSEPEYQIAHPAIRILVPLWRLDAARSGWVEKTRRI